MKIGFFEVEPGDKEYLSKQFPDHSVLIDEARLSGQNLETYKDVEVISTRSFSKPTKELIDYLPNLKMIGTRSTGVDHINMDYCREKGITVCNVPGYGEYTVAEHTIALMLAISRNIVPSVMRTREESFTSSGLRGFELHGKTLGVIGVGSIGRAVIRIAKALGMDVIAYTRTPDPEQADEYGFKYASLDDIFASSDILTLHVPYTPKTHYLINDEVVGKMKKGMIFINTARGQVVDTKALIDGLQDGTIAQAGLDVLEHENTLTDDEKTLLSMDNVIVTPHNAFNSQEALQRILTITVQNITAFIAGTPQNIVL